MRRWRQWWKLLGLVVIGGCHWWRKMMGRAPDGGCGTEERPCRPRATVSKCQVTQPEKPSTNCKKPVVLDVDFFSQARKALCERCPFDVTEDGPGSSNSSGLNVSTLPSGLASLLKPSDGRKKHKKSHSGAEKKSSWASERSKGGHIWVETEEYFRDLALPDIDALFEISSSLRGLAAGKCFLIPCIGNENNEKTKSVANTENEDDGDRVGNDNNEIAESALNMENVDNGECVENDNNGRTESAVNMEENVDDDTNVNYGSFGVDGNGVEAKLEGEHLLENDRAMNYENARVIGNAFEGNVEDEHLMETDSVGAQNGGCNHLPMVERKDLDLSSGLGWLLGCRDRILLTSERPSKKRKLLGTDAGLDKLLIGYPCDGNSSLCDFCCKGETDNDANPLIVCCSCKVAVHRRCYGVQGEADKSWLCSWCKQRTNKGSVSVDQLCVLCPKQGGALKPVGEENGRSFNKFAHLFCSEWMPEVYVEDLRSMEPIVNVEGIMETRKKLVCNLCKAKCGACVRCSHGTCRTAFHPICAREARHRMEVWGKYGSDNVELRAFCARHSEIPDGKEQKLGIGQNVEKVIDHVELQHANSSSKSEDCELQGTELSDSRSNATPIPECVDVDQLISTGVLERGDSEDGNPSNSENPAFVLKKLIDGGKVNLKDIATETGISSDSLISTLAEDGLIPDWRHKILKWLKNHVYVGTLHKILKVKAKAPVCPQTRMGIADEFDVIVSQSDVTYPITDKLLAPCRRTNGSIKIRNGNKVVCSSGEIPSGNGMEIDELQADQSISEGQRNSTKLSMPDVTEKKVMKRDVFQDSLAMHLPKHEDCSDDPSDDKLSEKAEPAHAPTTEPSNSIIVDQGNSICLNISPIFHNLMKEEACSTSHGRPSICQKLLEMQSGLLKKNKSHGFEGSDELEGKMSRMEASSNASVCCDHHTESSKCRDMMSMSHGVDLEQVVYAKKLGVLEMSADEVEGEIIYFQNMLLHNALAKKHFTDNLICKVAKSLPQEIDAARNQRWDAVLVNQYLCELREAKKQGRKEQRHKEAQAVLAAATAAAAASTRISSLRKDTFDESGRQEKFNTTNGRANISFQLMPHPKETAPGVAVPKFSSGKYSDFVQSISDVSKDHPRSCDICRRSETIMNPILVCSSCKVAVHLDCYRSVKESTGPWYCELCEELMSSKCSGAPSVNFWEKPYFVAECGLCGGSTGAFRKSSNGQWVHAFCAEWVFEPSFRRGQVNPIQGMENIRQGSDICCVCRRQHGVCINCCYDHCQTTFHPSCARSTGFYMNVKAIDGKLQHKAYCEKHSLEQRAKAETLKHGVEEIRSIRQIRVELERLRLLCERIVKREKLKRDLVLCSHNILACKRDHVVRSLLVHSSFFPSDVSSESATTSIKGNADGYKSYSDAFQRSDDVTVDGTMSLKNQIKANVSMDTDRKTEDSTTSQHLFARKPLERLSFGGKQILRRPFLASHNLMHDGEWSSRSRKTFEKKLVMTSDQASMKNQQLPKGYFYIPVDCIPKEKQQMDQDT